jgi:ABC-2 type transport system permease protein
MVMLKGTPFSDISHQFFITILYALVSNGLAIWSYKKLANLYLYDYP